jgi:hypothetical protein
MCKTKYFETIKNKGFMNNGNEMKFTLKKFRSKLIEIIYGDVNINVTDKEVYDRLDDADDSHALQFRNHVRMVEGSPSYEEDQREKQKRKQALMNMYARHHARKRKRETG